MQYATLEHANITVKDAHETAHLLCDIFGWNIRWQGDAKDGGHSIHVGGDDSYLAIYTPPKPPEEAIDPAANSGGLNHVGIIVDDLEAVEARVISAGLKPMNHADYEPGKRFYFLDGDQVEYEVVSYT